ncbi:MAG: MOSC domain-containing protein [Geminicoccaceae bacterium]
MSCDGDVSGRIIGVFIGSIDHPWPDKPPSAIAKQQVSQPVTIGISGIEGDEQADLEVHGGPVKAIHHYASEHMLHWQETFQDCASAFAPGCFGENISTVGLTENNLCLGDILDLGTAKVQICQGRQPCWKLNAHIGLKNLAFHFQTSRRTGWYYRVLVGGIAAIGDQMRVVERLYPHWPLDRVIEARFNQRLDVGMARELSEIDALSESWRLAFSKKSKPGFRENTAKRLKSP